MHEELRSEFEKLAKPLIKFINDNYNPHVSIIVTPTSAELVSGEISVYTEEFIKD